MSKNAWLAHILEVLGSVKNTPEFRQHVANPCWHCKERRKTLNAAKARKMREDCMRDLGLTKTQYGWE